jgi:hypothetical protein
VRRRGSASSSRKRQGSNVRASSARWRREAASTACQRRLTREQRLRSPDSSRPKTRARSSSRRSAVWSSPPAASAMEARSCSCGAARAGEGDGSGAGARSSMDAEGHWPMGRRRQIYRGRGKGHDRGVGNAACCKEIITIKKSKILARGYVS